LWDNRPRLTDYSWAYFLHERIIITVDKRLGLPGGNQKSKNKDIDEKKGKYTEFLGNGEPIGERLEDKGKSKKIRLIKVTSEALVE